MSTQSIAIQADSATELVHGLLRYFQSPDRRSLEVTVRDKVSYEHQNVLLTLSNPRNRITVPYNDTAPPLERFIGRALWEMMGSARMESIGYYDAHAPTFANADGVIPSAYGYRIKGQLTGVVQLLKHDPTTRRAVVLVLEPRFTDQYYAKGEFPCVVGLHFLIRNDILMCTCYMRSQSCLKVLPQDIFVFTAIHEWVADMVGKQLGSYTHFIVSAHVFESDCPYIDNIPELLPASPVFGFALFGTDDQQYHNRINKMDDVFRYEEALRTNTMTPSMAYQMVYYPSTTTELGQWLRVLAWKNMQVYPNTRYVEFTSTIQPLYRIWLEA